ncbi:MAG: hypothetical protein AAGF12_23490 [Myxococcota bacterium]
MAESNKVLKWVGIGCGVVVLLGACGIGACVLVLKGATDGPANAAHAFFGDLRSSNYQQALQRMSASYQATHPLPTFQTNVQQIPALTTQTDSTFTNRSISNNTATVSGNLTTAQGDVPVTVNLSKVGDHWYIDSVMVQGQNLM